VGDTETNPSLWKFPCDFPIKVMGRQDPGFEDWVTAIVRSHVPDLDLGTRQIRASRGGRYVSVTLTIRAGSREQLDAIYQDLSREPRVLMAL
jgi:hypothetical protein